MNCSRAKPVICPGMNIFTIVTTVRKQVPGISKKIGKPAAIRIKRILFRVLS
ncbi:MAG: hypothetical protein A4E38_00096 [Methanoregulaceae archaeon PtaB.Bin108]|nr:MAG: hypothetical protein A4E38_00096 [Methanoregulaceae archaeon PtaB.Bin108]